jgi:hypothetical protein
MKAELQQIQQQILNHPLSKLIKLFSTENLASDEEYYLELDKSEEVDETIELDKSEEIDETRIVICGIRAELHIAKERPFHHLRMFLKNVDETLIDENSFSDFIENEILKGRSIEEQEKNLEKARNLLNTLAMYAEYIQPIRDEALKQFQIKPFNKYVGLYWSTTHTANILEVGRKTIYNWLEECDFSAKKGKLNIEKLADYLKNKNPKYLEKLNAFLN